MSTSRLLKKLGEPLGGQRPDTPRGAGLSEFAPIRVRGQRRMTGRPGTLTSYIDAFCPSSTASTSAFCADSSALPHSTSWPDRSRSEIRSTVPTETYSTRDTSEAGSSSTIVAA